MPRTGFHGKHTQATKDKLSALNKGKKLSPETCKKMSDTRKRLGIKPKSRSDFKHSPETIEKIRQSNLGKKRSQNTIQKLKENALKLNFIPPSRKGAKEDLKRRIEKKIFMTGIRNPNWQGGLTSSNSSIRGSLEYKLWREAVFTRDNWTCLWCGLRGGRLNADHIKPFASYPKLRLKIENGRTLCIECHKKTESYLKRI